jgi:hypothetical protein
VIDPRDEDLYRELAGGLTTAHLLHGSANAIGGQDAVIKLHPYGRPQDLRVPGPGRGSSSRWERIPSARTSAIPRSPLATPGRAWG